MTAHCFAYGSLMCADIMARVAGTELPAEPAHLPGYARHPVRAEAYPGMVPGPGEGVDGVLYRDLPAAVWARLDAFEGEMYERQRVRVRLPDASLVEAWTYLFRPAYQHLLLPGDWDFAAFLEGDKARFSERYLGFDKLK